MRRAVIGSCLIVGACTLLNTLRVIMMAAAFIGMAAEMKDPYRAGAAVQRALDADGY
jgi:hypothetical protein